MPLTEISQVIAKLDYIINWSLENESPLGYFPALYQRTTIEVERAIDHGYFDHPEFVTKMDVRFAEYYLRAFEDYMRRSPYISSAWLESFKFAEKANVSVLQHLLMGMNAHINLDLGITMAELCTPDNIHYYKHDFYRINNILFHLIDQMQDMISQIWGPLKFLDYAMGRIDEKLIELILRHFRNQAWKLALQLVELEDEVEKNQLIQDTDARVMLYARKISLPILSKFNPFYYGIVVKENQNIKKIIKILHHANIYTKW